MPLFFNLQLVLNMILQKIFDLNLNEHEIMNRIDSVMNRNIALDCTPYVVCITQNTQKCADIELSSICASTFTNSVYVMDHLLSRGL